MNRFGIAGARAVGLLVVIAIAACRGPEASADGAPFILTSQVADEADIISDPVEERLREGLSRLEDESERQFAIVTTRSLDGHSIDDWSTDLFNNFGLGRRGYSDGVMLVVALEERQVRIEVGCGLEAWLTDDHAAKIIEERMLPLLGDGEMEGAIEAGANAIVTRLRADPRDDATIARDAQEACPDLAG